MLVTGVESFIQGLLTLQGTPCNRQLGDLELAVGEVDRFVDQLSCDLCAVHGALHRAPVCDGVPGRLSTQPWRTA